MRYPADPRAVEEIVAVMRHGPDDRHGRRLRAMIVVLWRMYETEYAHIITLREGLAVRVDGFPSWKQALSAAGRE
jgi:hypothetical protein